MTLLCLPHAGNVISRWHGFFAIRGVITSSSGQKHLVVINDAAFSTYVGEAAECNNV